MMSCGIVLKPEALAHTYTKFSAPLQNKCKKRFILPDHQGQDGKKGRKVGKNEVIASQAYFLPIISQLTASTLLGSDYPLLASDHSIIVLTFLPSSLSQHESGVYGRLGELTLLRDKKIVQHSMILKAHLKTQGLDKKAASPGSVCVWSNVQGQKGPAS